MTTQMVDEDAVTRIFRQMRSDMDNMLRQHEEKLRRSMAESNVSEPAVAEPLHMSPQLSPPNASSGKAQPVEAKAQKGPPATAFGVTTTPKDGTDPQRHTQHWSQAYMLQREEAERQRMGFVRQKSLALIDMVSQVPRCVNDDCWLVKLYNSKYYTFMRPFIIVADAAVVVTELVYATSTARDEQWNGTIPDMPACVVLTDIFCILLLHDLIFLFIVEFPRIDFIYGRGGYRWFNEICVMEQILQVFSQHIHPGQRSVSTFRIVVGQLSVIRTVRGVIVMPEVASKMELEIQNLRVMINSLMGSLQPLVFCAVPFMLMLMNFGVFVCEGTLIFLLKPHSSDYDKLKESFGTFGHTMLSLYKALLGGMDWGDLYDIMEPLEWYLKFGFLAFICFNFIALLNIVAAVFIKVAFIRTDHDKEFQIQKVKSEKKEYLDTMHHVFDELDEDGDGKLFRQELKHHFESPDVGAYFSKLGVDVSEVEKLFMLLDDDDSGSLDKEEFMFGCLRLKGEAKGLDLAILQKDVIVLQKEIRSLKRHTDNAGVDMSI